MSRTRIVCGQLTKVVEGDFQLFSVGNIVYNSQSEIIFKGEENGVCFVEPSSAPPVELSAIYIKVRLKDESKYNGEFGFDWLDINPDTKEVEKIQGVPFADVEYFYKKGNTANDLGNIIEKSTDQAGAKNAILSVYNYSSLSKHVDIPYVLVKPNQEIQLVVETKMFKGDVNGDIVSIIGDDFYEFEIVGGQKEGKTAKKNISKDEKFTFKIKCLKENSEKKYFFTHQNTTNPNPIIVGGFTMMENKVLKLKFRVIALVSNDNDPNAKAKALFKKFKDAGVRNYLNQNSLNQAGYEVEIENFNEMDNTDVDDYFYAFDKADWTAKKYFGIVQREEYKKTPEGFGILKPDGTFETEIVNKEALADDTKDLGENPGKSNEIDSKALEEYDKKIKSKGKSYSNGGYIILCDYIAADKGTGAYSRTSPLEHYTLIVFNKNTSSIDTYSHEIGHMLGLPHSFFTDAEKESYKIARENILGNGTADREGIKKSIRDVKNNTGEFYGYYYITAIKEDIVKFINKYNTAKKNEIEKDKKEVLKLKEQFKGLRDNEMINSTQTKKQYFDGWNNSIKQNEKYISDNKKALEELSKKRNSNYVTSESLKWFYRTDLIKLLDQNLKYYEMVISQIHNNHLFFKKASTKNILDYDNKRLFYTHNQIKIMRSDIQNYINIPCQFCK
jgi:hypothetical protein